MSAPPGGDPPGAPFQSSLRDYLDGAVVGAAHRGFEAGLYPAVRLAMLQSFPEQANDPVHAQFAAEALTLQARVKDIEHAELPNAEAALNAACTQWSECKDKAGKAALKKCMGVAKKAVEKLSKERDQAVARAAAGPESCWIVECRKSFGNTMHAHIKDGVVCCSSALCLLVTAVSQEPWDVHILVTLIKAHLPGVFAPR